MKKEILDWIQKKRSVSTSEIADHFNISRQYAHRITHGLIEEGKLVLAGKTNKARYMMPEEQINKATTFSLTFKNKSVSEDDVWNSITREVGALSGVSRNIRAIAQYAFTEICNNAIEHSQSKKVYATFFCEAGTVRFEVRDFGIGIFRNVMKKRKLSSEIAAMQDVLKGKQTTDSTHHTGEGIFFTSRIADTFSIKSFERKLVVDNKKTKDVFLKEEKKPLIGTRVIFIVSTLAKKSLEMLFRQYADASTYEFSKTDVKVHLFQEGVRYISRSQARRIMMGLEKFKSVLLDFSSIEAIGQGFADEIFRVWTSDHSYIKIQIKNANNTVKFMIERAKIVSK